MNLRWLWLDHIPPGIDVPKEIRREAAMMAKRHRRHEPDFHKATRVYLKTVLPFALILFVSYFALGVWIVERPPAVAVASAATHLIAVQALYMVGLWTIISYGMYKSNAPFVRHAMCQLGYPVCITCGYPLAGISHRSGECPECGSAYDSTDFGTVIDSNPMTDQSLIGRLIRVMKLRWVRLALPQLSLDSQDAQRSALLAFDARPVRRWWLAAANISWILSGILIGAPYVVGWIDWMLPYGDIIGFPLTMFVAWPALTLVCILYIAPFLFRAPLRMELKDALAERGVFLCELCGMPIADRAEEAARLCTKCRMEHHARD